MFYLYKDKVLYGASNHKEALEIQAAVYELQDYVIGETNFEDYSPSNVKYSFQNGKIVENINYEEITQQRKLTYVQNLRKKYLTDTDILVMVPDYPISKAHKKLCLAYRQYLRDLPKIEKNYPDVIVLTFDEYCIQKEANEI